MLSRQLCVLTLVAACGDAPRAPSHPGPSKPGGARVVALPETGDFDRLVADAAANARAAGLEPYLEFTAAWCAPCRHFEQLRDEPTMTSALAGTLIIQADYDRWQAVADRLAVSAIPTWLALDAQGRPRPERRIDGGAWSEDTAANMAPALGAFFHAGD